MTLDLSDRVDAAMTRRVRALRKRLERWPTAADATDLDPSLLGQADRAGYTFADLVADVQKLDGHGVVSPPAGGGVALLLGGAECVWRDVEASEEQLGPEWWDVCLAVNDIGVHWPRELGHWGSAHSQKFKADPDHPQKMGWLEQREANGHPPARRLFGKQFPKIVHDVIHSWGQDSGILGVRRAYLLGCPGIVLCGVPMDPREHFAESRVHVPGRPWGAADSSWKYWVRRLNVLRERTRSMSGRTRDELGAPTMEWLEACRAEEAVAA